MSQPETIYVISSGSYSDYSVHAVFQRKEDAEKFNEDKWYDIEEMPYYAEGEQPEEVVWYEGDMTVNDKEPTIRECKSWLWDWESDRHKHDRPVVNFRSWDKVPAFYGICNNRELLERALREKTLKYRAELDQLMRDVHGVIQRMAHPTRSVTVETIAHTIGREISVVAWVVQELQKMGLVADAPQARPVKREEIEPPEPGVYRIPIKVGPRPPKPEQISGDSKGTGE